MDDDGLPETHASCSSHTVEQFAILTVDKLPCRVAEPGKSTAVVVALGPLVAFAAAHVVAVDIGVGKLVEQLVGKGCLGTKDDAGVLL